ncbi:YHS domain-containing (seleno)protein [Cerasicoccus maritimus]|uniref:YHS domain-containing (seleno)protein n=1 Tax=Cerasicoccus maritimus TaxID=490089 RepID=UPI002852B6F6|nr:YHS domain-containing (seleno)protein [Cerasicoccus maritimus]
MKHFHAFLFALSLVAVTLAHAADDSASQSNSPVQSKLTPAARQADFNLSSKDLGEKGYDPVSYFSGKPVKGSKQFSSNFRGVTYYFANAANKKIFDADPGKYEPAFGGWCAWAMAEDGSKVDVDPTNYKIVDGRVYLFYNGFWGDTLKKWNAGDQTSLAKSANTHWSNILLDR